MEYIVKVSGVEQVEHLDKALTSLEAVLGSAKGSGKGLEEVRKIITGFKGQAGVFKELSDGVKGFNTSIDRVVTSVNDLGSRLHGDLKREFGTLNAVMQNALLGGGNGMMAKSVGQKLTREIGMGITQAAAEAEKVADKSAMGVARKLRKLATINYEEMVDGNGLKQLTEEDLKRLQVLKAEGADISNTHKAQLAAYEGNMRQSLLLKTEEANAEKAILERRANQTKIWAAQTNAALMAVTKGNSVARPFSWIDTKQTEATPSQAKQIDSVVNAEKIAAEKKLADDWAEILAHEKIASEQARLDKALVDVAKTELKDNWTTVRARDKAEKEDAKLSKALSDAAKAELKEDWAAIKAKDKAEKEDANLRRLLQKELEKEALRIKARNTESYSKQYAALTGGSANRTLSSTELGQLDTIAKSGGTSFITPQHMQQLRAYRSEIKETDKAQKENAKTLSDTKPKADNVSRSFLDMGKHAKDTHGAVRGLASGFNLLWLTWGSLVPLMAGAAISNGFMKAAKDGMEFGQTMEVIRVLGQNSAESVEKLSEKALALGSTSIHGPLAVAEAMKTLVLAGQSAEEALKSIDTTLNFSVAGTTDIQTAADVLVSVTTAFGTGAEGFARSADIIVRAAADSKASVESFGEAMKAASVVGEQYGGTQEDVAALISMLANLGIQGTAAGTAVRNMYADLSGRNMKVSKLLKEYNLDFRDMYGNMKPLTETVDILAKKLQTMVPKDGKDLLQNLLSERGGKAMIAALADYYRKNEEGISKLEQRVESLQNTFGDSALSAMALGNTTQSLWKRVGASMQTALIKSYEAVEPQLRSLATSLTNLFTNPQFMTGLQTMVSAIGQLAQVLANHTGTILTAAAAYGTYKLLMLGAVAATSLFNKTATASRSVLSSLGNTWSMATTSSTVYSRALRKNGEDAGRLSAETARAVNTTRGLGRTLGALASALPGIGTALAALTIGWDLYASSVNKAKNANKGEMDASRQNVESLWKELRARRQAAEETLKLAEKGASSSEVEAASTIAQFKATAAAPFVKDIKEANEEIERLDRSIKRVNEGMEGLNETEKFGAMQVLAGLQKQREAAVNRRKESQAGLDSNTSSFAEYELEAKNTRAIEEQRDALVKAREEAEQLANAMVTLRNQPGWKNKSEAAIKEEATRLMRMANGIVPPGGEYTPSVTLGMYDSEFEDFKLKNEAKTKMEELRFKKGITDAETYYARLKELENAAFEEEREALLRKEAKTAGATEKSDPRGYKANQEAKVALANLEANHAVAMLDLDQKRTKAVAEEVKHRREATVFGTEYLTKMRESAQSEVASMLMSPKELEAYNARQKIHEDFLNKKLDLQRSFEEAVLTLSGDALEKEKVLQEKKLKELADYEKQALELVSESERMKDEARQNSGAGYRRAMGEMREETTNFNDHAYSLTKTTANGMADSLTEFAMTGKASFSDLANSIVREMVRIAMQRAVLGLMDMLGGFGNVAGGLTGSLTSSASSNGFSSMGGVNYSLASGSGAPGIKLAKGGVVSSPSLSTYSNQVHSTPKFFAFAQGGVFGEAGPEAVMPLTRGADGNLGVRTYGGGASRSNSGVIVNVEVINNGSPVAATQQTSTNEDGEVFVRMILDTVNNDIQKGGRTARTVKQRFNLKG